MCVHIMVEISNLTYNMYYAKYEHMGRLRFGRMTAIPKG